MNKNQKQIIKTFYDAYLAGEDSLRKAIKERIDVLEKDTNWKRELDSGEAKIVSGYIPKNKKVYAGIRSCITFDDNNIYYMFLNNLFSGDFNITKPIYPKIKESLLKTKIDYFGRTVVEDYKRDDEYHLNEDTHTKLSRFKNKNMAYCVEKALFVQNIMSLLGIKSYILSSKVRIRKDANWEGHTYNIIRYDKMVRIIDLSLLLEFTYINNEYVKEEIWDKPIYLNDIHRFAKGQKIKVEIYDTYIDNKNNKEYVQRYVTYGNVGSKEKIFKRYLRTRLKDKEVDNEYLNKVIGRKRNIMREKEVYSSNTVMAYLLIPIDIVDDKKEYDILKNTALNENDLQKYIANIYINNVSPVSRKESNIQEFNIKWVLKDISYKGKETKILVMILPMASKKEFKFETIYTAIVFDDEFPRVFNLTYGYPTEKQESEDVVLHEVINTMICPIEPLKDTKIETFIEKIEEEINKEESILEREFDKYFYECFDGEHSKNTYKLALDIYNKKLIRCDFTNLKVVKYYTPISCKGCNLYCTELKEFPTTYNSKEYMGYTNFATKNLNCEYGNISLECPFRVLSFIERRLLNTKIKPDVVLKKLINIQRKRELM